MMESQRKERPRFSDMGFLLSDGTWCNRRSAMEIGIAAGQVSKRRDMELTANDLMENLRLSCVSGEITAGG